MSNMNRDRKCSYHVILHLFKLEIPSSLLGLNSDKHCGVSPVQNALNTLVKPRRKWSRVHKTSSWSSSPRRLGFEVRQRHLDPGSYDLLEAAVLALDQNPGHTVNKLLILSDLSGHVIREHLLLYIENFKKAKQNNNLIGFKYYLK